MVKKMGKKSWVEKIREETYDAIEKSGILDELKEIFEEDIPKRKLNSVEDAALSEMINYAGNLIIYELYLYLYDKDVIE